MGLFKRAKSLFSKKVEKKSTNNARYDTVLFLNGQPRDFGYAGNLYANALIRAVVDKLSTILASVPLNHVRGLDSDFKILLNSNINKLLTIKPNDTMTAFDLQYRTWTDLLIRNNSYEYIRRDVTGRIVEIVPIIANQVEVKERNGYEFYVFHFDNDKTVLPKEDIIHLRRFWYRNDYFGADNSPVRDDIALIVSMQKNIKSSLQNSAYLRGVLKHRNALPAEDLKKQREQFTADNLSVENSGGVAVIDDKFEFVPMNYQSTGLASVAQMNEIRNYIYRYFGVNDEIMLNTCNSDRYQSLFNSVLKPLINNKCQLYSNKLFSQKELDNGNRITSNIRQIKDMDTTQKINLVKLSLDGALYTPNEIRAWFGDAPYEGGDERQTSLNFKKVENESEKTEEESEKSEDDRYNTIGAVDDNETKTE